MDLPGKDTLSVCFVRGNRRFYLFVSDAVGMQLAFSRGRTECAVQYVRHYVCTVSFCSRKRSYGYYYLEGKILCIFCSNMVIGFQACVFSLRETFIHIGGSLGVHDVTLDNRVASEL